MLKAAISPLTLSGDMRDLGDTLSQLRAYIAEVGQLAVLDQKTTSRLQIAVDEIATNIITYGYATLEQHSIAPFLEVKATLSADSLTVTLVDASPPFDPQTYTTLFDPQQPLEEQKIGGIGIYLANHNVDSLRYERHDIYNQTIFIVRRNDKQATNGEILAEHLEQIILPLAIALSSEKDFDRLLEHILTEAKKLCNADAGTLYLRMKEDELSFAIIINDSLNIHLGGTSDRVNGQFAPIPLFDTGENKNKRNIASLAVWEGKTINIADIYTAQGYDFSAAKAFDQQTGYRTSSTLTVPFKDNHGQVVGVLQLLNAANANGEVIPFDNYKQLMVEILASQTVIALNNQLWWQQQQEFFKMQNDMQIAQTIQANFIPSELPTFRGWGLNGKFYPARDVSGDFYDVFTTQNKKFTVMIGDVCDKGVGAALFMSLTRSLLRAFATNNASWTGDLLDQLTGESDSGIRGRDAQSQRTIRANTIHNAVKRTNTYLMENHQALMMFTTLFIGMIDPTSGILTYINCGHTSPMLVSADGQIRQRLPPTAPAIGLYADAEFTIEEVKLEHGETLFCFTDGLTDARNANGVSFGEPALEQLINSHSTNNDLVDHIVTNVQSYIGDAVQYDDITLIATRRK